MSAALICGALDLGALPDPESAVQNMARTLAGPFSGKIRSSCEATICLAQITASGEDIASRSDHFLAADPAVVFLRSDDDTRLSTSAELLAPVAAFGDKAPDHLDGEFAFAHWDRSEQALTLVRDRAGVRPLFYVHRPGEFFAFASVPRALRAAGFATDDADTDVMVKLSAGNFAHGNRTAFRDIRRVMPGHRLIVSGDILRERSYHKLRISPMVPAHTPEENVVATLREKLLRAVQRRLQPEGPVFTHLSGGLDSSAITAILAQQCAEVGRVVHAYSFAPVLFDRKIIMLTEEPEVEHVAAEFSNIDLHKIRGRMRDVSATAALSDDHPSVKFAGDQYTQVLSDAKARGATSIFCGFGGDQAISHPGTGAFAEMLTRGRWRNLYRLLKARQAVIGYAPARHLWTDVKFYLLPEWAQKAYARLRGQPVFDRSGLLCYLRSDHTRHALAGATRRRANTRKARQDLLSWQHLSYVLEELACRAAEYGLSYTAPLLDTDLIDYVLRLPGEFSIIGGERRSMLREAVRGILPEQARLRAAKRLADPGEIVRVAEAREAMRAVIGDLRATPAADVFDLDRMEADITSMPSPESLVEMIEKQAAAGVQTGAQGFGFLTVLPLARFLGGLRGARLPNISE